MRVALWALALFAGCGNVASNKVDAHVDGPDPDGFGCPTTQLACSNTCIDPMTDNAHCGTCDNACQAIGSTCMAGHCVDTITSCAEIHMLAPSATSGFYTLHDGSQVYCDMINVQTFEAVGFGQYDVAHTGWTMVSLADLQNATMQSVFITLYNQQGGLKLVEPWKDNNCCFMFDNSTNNLMLQAKLIYPLVIGTTANECNVMHTAPLYTWQVQTSPAVTNTAASLPGNYFTTFPPTGVAQCSVMQANPAFFWRKHP
jgi:hypothetical protein